MTDVPLHGRTLIVGGLRTGKTTATAEALDRWLNQHGTDGVVVLDFAPEIETDDGLIGGYLERYITIPDEVHHGVAMVRGPRSESSTATEAQAIAATNARRIRTIIENAPPSPRAVFVNDVTLGVQHDPADVDPLVRYCSHADCVVLNGYEGFDFSPDDPITMAERRALDRLKRWADRVVDLGRASDPPA